VNWWAPEQIGQLLDQRRSTTTCDGSPGFPSRRQTWLWSESDAAFVVDVFRDEHDGDTWICRRDPSLTMPWTSVAISTPENAPYLIPEVVLLFKAKHARPKDLHDLQTTLPALDDRQRNWLLDSIKRVHPGHDWLKLI